MKNPQVIYLLKKKCVEKLDELYQQKIKIVTAIAQKSSELPESQQPKGMLSKFNPMSGMPDFDVIGDILEDAPELVQIMLQEAYLRHELDSLNLELDELLINQYLQGGEHG